MRTTLTAILIVVGLTNIGAQKKTGRAWEDGTWSDTSRVAVYAGSIASATATTPGAATGSNTAIYRTSQLFVIETADRWYVASQRLRFRWSKPVPMTVNAPVRFAVEKDKIYVIGEDQKEYELSIDKKGMKSAR